MLGLHREAACLILVAGVEDDMKRRDLLHAAAWAAVAAILPASWVAARGLAPDLPPDLPSVRRYGRHYVVNGWLVTERDLEALRRHAA
jgi:predicted nicotinamide N-methyase